MYFSKTQSEPLLVFISWEQTFDARGKILFVVGFGNGLACLENASGKGIWDIMVWDVFLEECQRRKQMDVGMAIASVSREILVYLW